MKNIDIKSLIIGALLTSTIFLGVAATSPTDKWDKNQKWEITLEKSSYQNHLVDVLSDAWDEAADGAEPFAVQGQNIIFRKRIK